MRSSFTNFDKKFFYGNSYDFGDFDSCLNAKNEDLNFVGKFCLIKYYSDDVTAVPPSKIFLNI